MRSKLGKVGTGLGFFLILMFQVATGFSAILISGIVDPMLVNELGVPAVIVGLLLGVHFLAEPIRSYIGSLSDRVAVKKLHRVPFMLGGGFLLALTYPLMILVLGNLRDPNYHKIAGQVTSTTDYQAPLGWLIVAFAVFFLNGTGISIMGTAALSLIVDVTTEKVRGLIAAFGWTLLIVGFIVGTVISTQVLPDTEGFTFVYSSLYPVFLIIAPAVIMGLVLLACLGALLKEPRNAGVLVQGRTYVNFRQAMGVVSRNRQTRWFFLFLLVSMTFIFMRDVLTPNYASNVFKMSLKERNTLQNSINGPILIAMIATGLLTLRIAKDKITYVGIVLTAIGIAIQAISAFAFQVSQNAVQAYDTASQQYSQQLISKADYDTALATWNSLISGNKGSFTLGLIVMGLGLGVAVPGLIGLMMDLTDSANAALYIGTWGIAQAFGQGLSNVLAGGLRDVAYNSFKSNLATGYALVFLFQGAGVLLSIWILRHINVAEFKRSLTIRNEQAEALAFAPIAPSYSYYLKETSTPASTKVEKR